MKFTKLLQIASFLALSLLLSACGQDSSGQETAVLDSGSISPCATNSSLPGCLGQYTLNISKGTDKPCGTSNPPCVAESIVMRYSSSAGWTQVTEGTGFLGITAPQCYSGLSPSLLKVFLADKSGNTKFVSSKCTDPKRTTAGSPCRLYPFTLDSNKALIKVTTGTPVNNSVYAADCATGLTCTTTNPVPTDVSSATDTSTPSPFWGICGGTSSGAPSGEHKATLGEKDIGDTLILQ